MVEEEEEEGNPYNIEAAMTKVVPMRKEGPGERSSNVHHDTTEDTMIEKVVAKPLRILSAYLMVAATTIPPNA